MYPSKILRVEFRKKKAIWKGFCLVLFLFLLLFCFFLSVNIYSKRWNLSFVSLSLTVKYARIKAEGNLVSPNKNLQSSYMIEDSVSDTEKLHAQSGAFFSIALHGRFWGKSEINNKNIVVLNLCFSQQNITFSCPQIYTSLNI